MSSLATLSNHYEDVSKTYESAFFYSSESYRDFVIENILLFFRDQNLEISPATKVVDLGGGTGNFTQCLALAAGLTEKILCVDAFQEMLNLATEHSLVDTLLMDAVDFSQLPGEGFNYKYILLKELIHHISIGDLEKMFSGLYRQLEVGGTALTITRPQEVDFPFFEKAREVWRNNQPAIELIVPPMRAAGFDVIVYTKSYPVKLKKADWIKMVSNKFWSTFSLCTPEELSNGIHELEEKFRDVEELTFDDNLLFIVARKK